MLDSQGVTPAATRSAAPPGCACRGAGRGSLRRHPRQAHDAAEPRATPTTVTRQRRQGTISVHTPSPLPGLVTLYSAGHPGRCCRSATTPAGPTGPRLQFCARPSAPAASDVVFRTATEYRLRGKCASRKRAVLPPLPPRVGPQDLLLHKRPSRGVRAALGCAHATGLGAQRRRLEGLRGGRGAGAQPGGGTQPGGFLKSSCGPFATALALRCNPAIFPEATVRAGWRLRVGRAAIACRKYFSPQFLGSQLPGQEGHESLAIGRRLVCASAGPAPPPVSP